VQALSISVFHPPLEDLKGGFVAQSAGMVAIRPKTGEIQVLAGLAQSIQTVFLFRLSYEQVKRSSRTTVENIINKWRETLSPSKGKIMFFQLNMEGYLRSDL